MPWITTAASAGQSEISRSNSESGTQGGRSSQGYVSDGLLLYKGHEIESGPDAIAGLRELGRKKKKKKEKKRESRLKRKAMRLIAEAATRRELERIRKSCMGNERDSRCGTLNRAQLHGRAGIAFHRQNFEEGEQLAS